MQNFVLKVFKLIALCIFLSCQILFIYMWRWIGIEFVSVCVCVHTHVEDRCQPWVLFLTSHLPSILRQHFLGPGAH